MVQETAFLSLVGLLDEVLEDLVFELRDQWLVDLEVDEAVAEVSLEAVGHLDEVSGFLELLLLNFEDTLEEVVVWLLVGFFGLFSVISFVLERGHLSEFPRHNRSWVSWKISIILGACPNIEVVIGVASGALGGLLEMTHHRLFHERRWDFSGWVHVV